MKVELNECEAEALREFIGANLFHCIKWDGIAKIQNLHALLNVWYKCGGIYVGED